MSIFSSYKKIFLLGFLAIILVTIPFSVYIAQQRQRTITKAAASTTLSFDPASSTVEVDKTLTLGIILDPGKGTTANLVSFVKLSISYDSSKFATVTASLTPNPSSPNTLTTILEDPVYALGKATISLSIGADPTKVLTARTKIAILKLKALSITDANNPSSITFDSDPNTQVLSIASSDQTNENVLLSTTQPANVIINPASSSPSPAGVSVSATSTPTPTPVSGDFPQAPVSQGTSQIGGAGLGTGSAVFNPAPVFETEPSPTPIMIFAQEPLPPTGPGEKMLGIGIIGAILTIIGTAVFILL